MSIERTAEDVQRFEDDMRRIASRRSDSSDGCEYLVTCQQARRNPVCDSCASQRKGER
jgi:hypothetical protein